MSINKAHEHRGRLLNECLFIEKMIESYICNYLIPDDEEKRIELQELIIGDRMFFENKRQALQHLLEKRFDLEYKSKCGKQMSKITDVINLRNLLAHQLLDNSVAGQEEMIKGSIGFIRLKNETKIKWLTLGEIEEKYQLLQTCKNWLFELGVK